MIQPFRKIRTQNKELTQLQNSIARIFLDLLGLEILNGRLIEDVAVETTQTAVSHGLGRELRGWFVVEKTANVRIFRVKPTENVTTTLYLDTTADATISLWVF